MNKINNNLNKYKHNTNCCVLNCHSRKVKNPNLHYHYFPKGKLVFLDAEGKKTIFYKRKTWEQALLMKKRATKYLRVCSLHFKDTDYLPTRCTNNAISSRLKPFAVPSLNLPSVIESTNKHKFTKKKKFDQQRLKNKFIKKNQSSAEERISILTKDELLVANSLLELHNY